MNEKTHTDACACAASAAARPAREGTGSQTAHAAHGKYRPLYDRDDFVLCVLNEYGEVWLYYTSHTLNADNSLTYTHDAAGDICVTTGAKAISVVDYGLLVLDQDGTLRF